MRPDDLDQIVVGQDFGELEDWIGDAVGVLGQRQYDLVGHVAGPLQVLGQRLAYPHLGVADHEAEDILGDTALRRPHYAPVEVGRDLGRRRPGLARGIGQKTDNVVLAQRLLGHGS